MKRFTPSCRKQLGFNLIEVLIVVAIFAVLATMGASSYNGWIASTRIRGAAEGILNGLQKAKSEALKRNTNVTFTLGSNGNWRVECATASNCPDLTAGLVEARSDINDAKITIGSSGQTIATFSNLGTKSGTLASIDVSYSGVSGTRPLRITIGGGGTVRLCDVNALSGDPRAC